jgi:hypothetical protein
VALPHLRARRMYCPHQMNFAISLKGIGNAFDRIVALTE